MAESLSLTISNELVEPIVREKIRLAIIETLGKDSERIIGSLADKILRENTGENGKRSTGSDAYYDKTPFIEAVSAFAVQEATREAVREWVAENKPAIKEAVKKAIARRTGRLADAFVDTIVASAGDRYRMSVEVSAKPVKD